MIFIQFKIMVIHPIIHIQPVSWISFSVLSIGAMNVLIGLCVANIKDIMMQKEDFKLGQMIINNVNTEVNQILETLYYQNFFFLFIRCL